MLTVSYSGNMVQYVIVWVLALGAFATEVYALVDAVRVRSESFEAAGKLTKTKWLAILGVATALGFLALPLQGAALSALSFLPIIAFVGAAVYLADVKPAVHQFRGGSGGGSYGSW